jgi:NAD(P)-dependent dehydrogenase (short-subunit alcohol dehydrogenase family)
MSVSLRSLVHVEVLMSAGSTRSRAVLVTGAAGGLGAATVQTLADRGYRVYAGVRGETGRLEGAGIETVQLDVTDPDSVRAAAGQVARRQDGRGLHAVVNNAGVVVQGPLELVPPAEIRRQFEVNVYGPANVTQAFLPLLRQGRGRVVSISGAAARTAVPFLGPLSASKAALDSLSDALRIELAPFGIPVSVVRPGGIDTRIGAKADAALRAALAGADPRQLALYQRQLEALGAAMARHKPSPVAAVADVVVTAVRAPRPRPCYLAGSDARLAALLSRLPVRLRDRMLTRSLGLARIRPAAA